jgi:hypothetical protein
MVNKQKFDESLYWFYHSDNLPSFLVNGDNLLRTSDKNKITCQVVTSKFDIVELLNSNKDREFSITERKTGEDIHFFSIQRKLRRDSEIISGNILVIKYSLPNVYIIVTHENTKFIHKCLFRLLDSYYPKVSRMSMDSKYIYEILKKLNSTLENKNIRVLKVIKKGWVKSEFAKKKIESDIKWTDLSFDEVFQALSESEEWIKSIDFAISRRRNKEPSYLEDNQSFFTGYSDNYRISREGLFKCNQNFAQMYAIIIEELAKKASFNFELFNNRNRNKEEKFDPKPLLIQFDFDIFRDKIENKRLMNVLNKIAYSSLSVFHGNPYFNATYVDYRDGSSYDLWVLSNDCITIVPQMRSTPASLDRLCESIFTGFREGVIKDFEVGCAE